jgi:hypothetical protein
MAEGADRFASASASVRPIQRPSVDEDDQPSESITITASEKPPHDASNFLRSTPTTITPKPHARGLDHDANS